MSVLFLGLALGSFACSEPAPSEPAPTATPAKPTPPAPVEAPSDEPQPQAEPTQTKPDLGNAEAAPAAISGPGAGVEIIALHEHELLGSENRALDKLKSRLEKKGLKVTRAESLDAQRKEAIETWLSTRDAAKRAELPRALTMGDSAGLVVLHLRPPGGSSGKVRQGQSAVGVLGRTQDLLWLEVEGTGLKPLGDLDDEFAALLEPLEGVKG